MVSLAVCFFVAAAILRLAAAALYAKADECAR
jgi:hypothetical protein